MNSKICVMGTGSTGTKDVPSYIIMIGNHKSEELMNAVDEHNAYGSGYYYNYYQSYTVEN